MTDWKPISRAAALVAAAAIVGALLAPLSGCLGEDSALQRFAGALGGRSYDLSPQERRQFTRFRAVYDELATGVDSRSLEHFSDAFKRVREDYVREVDDALLIDAAIAGVQGAEGSEAAARPPAELVEAALDSMLSALDPHSSYLNPDELRETRVSTRGEFGGLGIEVTLEDGLVKVISPIEDTPAFRAGLKPGDMITHLDGDSIKGLTLMQAVKRMRGRPGTDIRLTVERQGYAPFAVTITRAIIVVRPVRWRTEGDIGYIRVAHFSEHMDDALDTAVDAIYARLGKRMQGLVLDLRNNPGGLLDQSVLLADAFLENGRIVSVRGRDWDGEQVVWAEAGDVAAGLPMVVLINGGSASASEIVAGALQDHRRATVMGMRSFGKGSVQTIMPLPVEGALRLTTALYYAPSGRTIQAAGIEPDIVVVSQNAPKFRREADLPGVLRADAPPSSAGPRATVDENDCPAAGDKDDRVLGCALAFLRAGSTEGFLATIDRGTM